MKILMINSVCGIQSTGRICTDLADIWELQGHTCKIAYGRDGVPEKFQKYAVRIGSDFGVKFHGVYSRVLDRHGMGSRRATKKFIKWVKEYDPDVIHLHNIHGYYINIEVLFDYLKTCEKKIIWTFHDCWPFTGHCAYFTAKDCNEWKSNSCINCRYINEYPKSILLCNSKNNYNLKKSLFTEIPNMTIVTPSTWLANLVGESFLGSIPTKVIHNGIDLAAFSPDVKGEMIKKYDLDNKKIVLGVASVWDERKGLPDLLKLATILPDNYRVVIVGLSADQVSQLPENIIGIERTNNVNELAQLYAAATVFYNPTYEDNFPTTNIEALACGTPVITYKTGGSPESIDEGCGYVFEQGDIQSVADAIINMREKAHYMDVCVARGRLFDKKRMCEEYSDIINSYLR